jgi:hypothetical protein
VKKLRSKRPGAADAALQNLNAWNFAVVRAGPVYILAGTGIADITKLPNTPETAQQIERHRSQQSKGGSLRLA